MSELPSSWEWSTIGDLASYIQRGKSPKYADRSALPVVNQRCIRWNQLEQKHLKFIHPDQFSAWDSARYIRPGDVLWNSTGTGTVGRAYLVREADCIPPKVVDSHVTIVRHALEIDPRYLFNWIKSPAVQGKIEEMCDGTTNQIELSRTAIAATAMPIAPAAEQTRIADQLDTLLARIQACSDRLDAIPALLKRFRQAVLNSAVVGELIESGQQGDLADWQESTIGAIATDVRYGTSKKCSYESGGHGVLRIPNIARYGAIDRSDLKRAEFDANEVQKLALQDGDLLVIRSNGSLGLVGMCSLVSEKEAGLLYAGYLMRLRVDRSKANPAYVQICISATTQRRLIERTAKSTSGVNNLNAEELRSLPLTLPPLNVQEKVVRRVRVLFGIADRIESRYSAAFVHLQRLAPRTFAKAFRGELVQQDANDEPASVLLQRIARTPLAAVKAPRGRPQNRQPEAPLMLPAVRPHWSELPAGAWAASGQPNEHATTAQLIAVLKAWGQPMPQDQARLAAVLCLQPRLFTAALPAQDAAPWRRLVGAEAEPLPASVAALQPAVNAHWRRALASLRARGDLVVSGGGPQDTWALGPGADHVDTTGWPDGRAGWVAAYLRAHGVEALLPLLSPAAVDFVHARAA